MWLFEQRVQGRAHAELHDKYTRKAGVVTRENDQRGWVTHVYQKKRKDACDSVEQEYDAAYKAWKVAHPDQVHGSAQTEETYRFRQARIRSWRA